MHDDDVPHLEPLSRTVELALEGRYPMVLAAVREAEATWKGLHDRLIAIIVGFLDEAVEQGAELSEVLEAVRRRTTVAVPDTSSSAPSPLKIAALLRSHGAVGTVHHRDESVEFEHSCGSGQHHWRNNPSVAKVKPGEVDGVPAGLPRYCARCIDTVNALGTGGWQITPPESVEGRCRWTVPVGISAPPTRDR